jgi:hypothetical protein
MRHQRAEKISDGIMGQEESHNNPINPDSKERHKVQEKIARPEEGTKVFERWMKGLSHLIEGLG